MSAAILPRPRAAAEGWPPLKPGFCQVPHWLMRRARRITANAVEADVLRLVLDETVGWRKDKAALAEGWFAEELDVTDRAVRDALKGLVGRGLVVKAGGQGAVVKYGVDLAACEKAPDYEPPETKTVEMPELEEAEPEEPRIREVLEKQLSFYGKQLVRPRRGRVVAAEEKGLNTVARCGECETVGIFEMISTPELEFRSKDKAKVQPINRKPAARSRQPRSEVCEASTPSPANGKPPSRRRTQSPPGEQYAGPPGGPARERVIELQQGLTGQWKDSHFLTPCTIREASAVAVKLGNDAPVVVFLRWLAVQKVDQVFGRNGGKPARRYSFFCPLAEEFRKFWERDQGHLCPQCKATRLRHGDVCACSTAAEQRAEPPADEYWSPIKTDLKSVLTKEGWANWIGPTWLESAGKGLLRVGVPDAVTKDWLSEEYSDKIRAALMARYGSKYDDVEFVVRGGE